MSIQLHADRKQLALVHGAQLPWIPSPESGVERRMLERSGGEVALASTIVRYLPGSAFRSHTHDMGEEFVVLEGTFSDERGDYPTGSYVRNPPGSKHAPFSREGCVIFVKLRQMSLNETEQVTIWPHTCSWQQHEQCSIAPLYSKENIAVSFERLMPGYRSTQVPLDGEELFVMSGNIQLQGAVESTLGPWSWLRYAGHEEIEITSEHGALLWVKRGHLGY